MENQKINKNDIDFLVYASGHVIYFVASSVISKGLLTIKKPDGTLIIQKILSNTNYENFTIPKDESVVYVSIISNENNYEKTLIL